MTAATLTLADFIMQRIAEDEARATGREIPDETECPCGEVGYVGEVKIESDPLGDGPDRVTFDITHIVGYTDGYDSVVKVGWTLAPQRLIHELRGETARQVMASWPLDSHSRRVLAECAAKRAIVEHCTDEYRRAADGYQMLPPVLEALASVYADHPDFRQEWATP